MTTPPRRLLLAFAASLLLHAITLGSDGLRKRPKPPPTPVLQATLRLPPPIPATPAAAEALLKNTLDDDSSLPRAEAEPPPLPVRTAPAARPAKAEKRQVQAAQKKLAEHLYYPAEAIAGNLEGEVRLILTLTPDGGIADVQLAASSGHRLLDDAAIRAAWAMGRPPGVTARELILPVIFRLQ